LDFLGKPCLKRAVASRDRRADDGRPRRYRRASSQRERRDHEVPARPLLVAGLWWRHRYIIGAQTLGVPISYSLSIAYDHQRTHRLRSLPRPLSAWTTSVVERFQGAPAPAFASPPPLVNLCPNDASEPRLTSRRAAPGLAPIAKSGGKAGGSADEHFWTLPQLGQAERRSDGPSPAGFVNRRGHRAPPLQVDSTGCDANRCPNPTQIHGWDRSKWPKLFSHCIQIPNNINERPYRVSQLQAIDFPSVRQSRPDL
jgi:hypothetical protein